MIERAIIVLTFKTSIYGKITSTIYWNETVRYEGNLLATE